MATTESISAAMATMQADIDFTKGDIQQERATVKNATDLLNQAAQRVSAEPATATAMVNQLQAQQAQEVQAAAVITKAIRDSGDALTLQVIDAVHRLAQLEQRGVGSSASASGNKPKWELTRPKDMEPDMFTGKDEEWLRWKEATEDNV